MEIIQLALNLFLLSGAVNTGVLVSDGKALLFDCDDTVTLERLAEIGVNEVDMILATQHRRVNVAGAYGFVPAGAKLIVPDGERHLFEDVESYWLDWRNRYHNYAFQPGPQVLAKPLPVYRGVSEGDVIEWRGHRIRVIDTPGATTGAVSYLVGVGDKDFCFSGDAIYGPGQVLDFYSLQKGYETTDYHAFLVNMRKLVPSLQKLAASGADVLLPSHGRPIKEPSTAVALTIDRLEKAWRSYGSISSLHHYHADVLADIADDPARMPAAETHPEIDFLKRIKGYPSFVLISESGAALVIDCGYDRVVDELRGMINSGEISSVEGVWITHYHDDHVDGLGRLVQRFGCPVMTDEKMAEIIEHPDRFFLPCLSHASVNVTKKTTHGEKWRWREFSLTAYHFPGQTYYHSGLLAEGRGKRIFLAGDSFSPAGIDDYCAHNRNFLGKGRGFDKCLDLIRELKPDAVINPHQDLGVRFGDKDIDYMKSVLAEREKLFAKILPWEHPNFGTDPWWVRSYPYEQDVYKGDTFTVGVTFTNHAGEMIPGKAEPVLPEGWRWILEESDESVAVPPLKDVSARLRITAPESAAGKYVIPLRITWNGRYLGQMRHAIVNVMGE